MSVKYLVLKCSEFILSRISRYLRSALTCDYDFAETCS